MVDNWAMTVVSKPWGIATVVLDWAKRKTRYRFFVHSAHRSWEHAVGVR